MIEFELTLNEMNLMTREEKESLDAAWLALVNFKLESQEPTDEDISDGTYDHLFGL